MRVLTLLRWHLYLVVILLGAWLLQLQWRSSAPKDISGIFLPMQAEKLNKMISPKQVLWYGYQPPWGYKRVGLIRIKALVPELPMSVLARDRLRHRVQTLAKQLAADSGANGVVISHQEHYEEQHVPFVSFTGMAIWSEHPSSQKSGLTL